MNLYTHLCMGIQPQQKHFDRTLLFCDCKSKSHHKDKDCMKDITLIQFIPVLHAENSVPMLYFYSHLYPQKGY